MSFGGFGGSLPGAFGKTKENEGRAEVNSQWQTRLEELLEEDNAIHNTTTTLRARRSEFSESAQLRTPKTPKTPRDVHIINPANRAAMLVGGKTGVPRMPTCKKHREKDCDERYRKLNRLLDGLINEGMSIRWVIKEVYLDDA